MKILVVTLCAILTTTCARAQSVPLVPPPDTVMLATWSATLHQPPATRLDLGTMHVRFGITTLRDVLTTIGVGQILHRGDAGGSTTWLCYTVVDHENVSRLWLVSGEIDGGKYVTGTSAKRMPSSTHATPTCPALPPAFSHPSIDNGVWLGVSEKELANKIGAASHAVRHQLMFDYTRIFKAKNCEEAEQDSSLWVKLKNGRIEELQAYQTKTC